MKINLKIAFLFLAAMLLSGCGKIEREKINVPSNSILSVAKSSRKPIKILFVGDMMFDRYVREGVEKYGKGDYNYSFNLIKDYLSRFDLVVGNLEGPITDRNSVSVGTAMDEKNNFKFTFAPAVAKTLAENNVNLVNLGNNHILNQGEEGLVQTKKNLDSVSVQYFGDTGDGQNPALVKNIGGIKLGFVNYNYSIAGSFERAIRDIKNIRAQADVVIVCPHWGTEYKIGDPGQEMRSEAYQFIDAGADAVIGTHPHVIEDSEVYKGKKIYYSLGNFIFDQYFQKETMEGLGVEATVRPDLNLEYNDVKFVMNRKGQTEMK